MEEEDVTETKHSNVEGETKRVRRRRKKIYQAILQQMEFYFSDANLSKDRFLHSLVQEDPYVDLSVFLKFNKIRALTDNVEDIANALSKSELLTLSTDRTKVCRESPVRYNYNEDECSIYVESLPPDAKHEWLKDTFSVYGKVAYVSIPKYKQSGKIKGFAFVEFESPEVADRALEAYRAAGCCLPSDMAPEQLCSVSTFEPTEGKNQVGAVGQAIKLEGDDAEEESGDAKEVGAEEVLEEDEPDAESGATLSKEKKKRKRKKVPSDEEEEAKGEEEEEEIQPETEESSSSIPKKRKKSLKEKESDEEEENVQGEEEEEAQSESEKSSSPVSKKRRKKIKKEKEGDDQDDETQEADEEEEKDSNVSSSDECSSLSKDKERKKRKLEEEEDNDDEEQPGEENKKARLEDESADVKESSEEQKRKKTRKKKNKDKKEKLAEEAVGLHILSKKEWKRLRNKYLTLQRKNMKNLRKQIMGGRWGNYWETNERNGKKTHDEDWDEVDEKGMECSEDYDTKDNKGGKEKVKTRVQFTPGVIMKIQLKEPLESAKKFKGEVKNLPKSNAVAYVDAKDANSIVYFRCETAEGAKDLLEELPWEDREILEGEEEKDYWDKILRDRDEKITKKIRVKQRGRDKILKKAENLIGKHVRYEN